MKPQNTAMICTCTRLDPGANLSQYLPAGSGMATCAEGVILESCKPYQGILAS